MNEVSIYNFQVLFLLLVLSVLRTKNITRLVRTSKQDTSIQAQHIYHIHHLMVYELGGLV